MLVGFRDPTKSIDENRLLQTMVNVPLFVIDPLLMVIPTSSLHDSSLLVEELRCSKSLDSPVGLASTISK